MRRKDMMYIEKIRPRPSAECSDNTIVMLRNKEREKKESKSHAKMQPGEHWFTQL